MKAKILKFLAALFAVAMLILLAVAVGVYFLLRGSLTVYGEDAALPGLSAAAEVTIDDFGVPFIKAKTRADALRALGYMHAKERLYAMEMQRRLAAGELAEIVGWPAYGNDQTNRRFGFRERARADLAAMPGEDRALLDAYCEGVNAVISELAVRPWELLALRSHVQPWKPEDSLLVGYSMYIALQQNMIWGEKCRMIMASTLPREVYEFFVENGSDWDATLDGKSLAKLPVPDAESFAYLKQTAAATTASAARALPPLALPDGAVPGSNGWAVSGDMTSHGGAMLANDMHLALRVPNIWYRASYQYEQDGETTRLYGATLPGLPLTVIGSNGHIAWGFTNSRVDTVDLVSIAVDPQDPERYLTPKGSEPFAYREEIIKVKGAEPQTVTYKFTKWGPIEDDLLGRQLALRWRAMQPGEGINLRLGAFEQARTTQEAVDLAPSVDLPTLNLVLADSSGSIAWTLIGPAMARANYRGDLPEDSAKVDPEWRDLDAGDYPAVVDPEDGYVWLANSVMLGDESYLAICQNDTFTPIRSYQIRERLKALEGDVSEEDLFAIQLDVDALFYERWKDLMLEVMGAAQQSGDATFDAAIGALRAWDGQATADSTGFLLARDFKDKVTDGVLRRLLAGSFDAYQYFWYGSFRYEDPLWEIVSQRPEYLHAPAYESWEAELLDYARQQIAGYRETYGEKGFDGVVWGDVNRLEVQHPIGSRIPLWGGYVNMDSVGVSGDGYVTNVVYRNFGSTERFVVAPGREESGIFQMPGGQSGHPFSEYYRAGHDAWVQGVPTPLASSNVAHRFSLAPR